MKTAHLSDADLWRCIDTQQTASFDLLRRAATEAERLHAVRALGDLDDLTNEALARIKERSANPLK